MTDYAQQQADAQMGGICDMAAALAVDYDRLEALREEVEDLYEAVGEAQEAYDDALADEDGADDMQALGETLLDANNALAEWHRDYREELDALEEAAGYCENREEAEQRVHEDALSVEVRSDWHVPGGDDAPAEFRIVLCTGGPHVEMRGELNEHGEPVRAWLVYNDWFKPMTERPNGPGDEEELLAYAACFYYGEG